jgi:hypothetical protein
MTYNGRRGPNVSQYVANLNSISPVQDHLSEPVNIEEDLALFTNSEFIDWDLTGNFDLNPPLDLNLDAEPQQRRGMNASGPVAPAAPAMHHHASNKNTNKPMDFVNGMYYISHPFYHSF